MVLVQVVVLMSAVEPAVRVRAPTPALEAVAVTDAALMVACLVRGAAVLADEAGPVVSQELSDDGQRAADYDEVGFDTATGEDSTVSECGGTCNGGESTYIHMDGVATAQGWSAAVSMGKRVTRRTMLVMTVLERS